MSFDPQMAYEAAATTTKARERKDVQYALRDLTQEKSDHDMSLISYDEPKIILSEDEKTDKVAATEP